VPPVVVPATPPLPVAPTVCELPPVAAVLVDPVSVPAPPPA
jgi:hypothetical protein